MEKKNIELIVYDVEGNEYNITITRKEASQIITFLAEQLE